MKNFYFGLPLLFIFILSCTNNTKKNNIIPLVEVKYQNGNAKLYRNGMPYHIRGGAGVEHLEKLSMYGGNSIRTWSTHNAKELLDEAHSLGLTVTLGLEIGRPHWGEDFNYWNLFEVNKKIEELRPIIEELKDHPALLMWGVGNEVALEGGPRYLVYFVINRVAKMVKEVDPNHPVMTAINSQIIGRVKYLMTDIDILGYNGFKLLDEFYQRNKNYVDKGWGKAYIFSEWGPPGHWEVNTTEWGAPYEMNIYEKLYFLDRYWKLMNQDSVAFLGSYAFYWGHKYEITPTWFSHFSKEGLEGETVNFLRTAWSGYAPENVSPHVLDFLINGKKPKANLYLDADSTYTAEIRTFDEDPDGLTIKWEIRPEELKFHELSEYNYSMNHLFDNDETEIIKFKAPRNEGPYRIFVFISNDKGYFTTHSTPFYVVNR